MPFVNSADLFFLHILDAMSQDANCPFRTPRTFPILPFEVRHDGYSILSDIITNELLLLSFICHFYFQDETT